MTFSLESSVQSMLSMHPFLCGAFQGQGLKKIGQRCPGGAESTGPLASALNVWAELQDRNNQELWRRLERLGLEVLGENLERPQDPLPNLAVEACAVKVGIGVLNLPRLKAKDSCFNAPSTRGQLHRPFAPSSQRHVD